MASPGLGTPESFNEALLLLVVVVAFSPCCCCSAVVLELKKKKKKKKKNERHARTKETRERRCLLNDVKIDRDDAQYREGEERG